MKIHIFDVEHGECNIVETPLGGAIMIGTGHNSSSDWRPSQWLRSKNLPLTTIVLSNLDEDHVSDLPNFEPNLRPSYIMRNYYLDPQWVHQTKIDNGGIGNGVLTALHWINNVFTGSRISVNYGLEVQHFYHPQTRFQDTNNLSVVTFFFYNNIGLMFPGDLQKEGWEAFLENPQFINCLKRTKILLASHHGRENGYSEPVFNYCRPDVIIISDKSIEHETQDHDLYSSHASGLNFSGNIRKVLTTRSDGKITIDIPEVPNSYTVSVNQSY